MPIDKTIFRKYDIRGRYPEEFNEEAAYQVALAFANLFPSLKRIVVGGDIRKSTPSLKDAVIRGLQDGGKEVFDAGIAITPLVFFAVCHHGYDGGIVVTASHLGAGYNGLKFVLANARPTLPGDYEAIQDLIVNDRLVRSGMAGRKPAVLDIEDEYIDYIKSKIKLARPLKVIIDAGNGAVGRLPERIFRALGCEARTIFAEPDDTFPHHTPDPYLPENMLDLRTRVEDEDADLGIAYDGDGDRAGFIDSTGRILTGDELLLIFTRDTFEHQLGPIAVDARASMALIEEVRSRGQHVELTVGYHAAVLNKILEIGAVFGGETTQHYYFPLDIYLTDDAVYASLKLASIAARTKDFAALVSALPRYATSHEIFIDCPDNEKYDRVDRFTELVREQRLDLNDVDGARINLRHGWGIVRPSNTSPFIKVKFEGRTAGDLKDVARQISDLMAEADIYLPEKDRKVLGI